MSDAPSGKHQIEDIKCGTVTQFGVGTFLWPHTLIGPSNQFLVHSIMQA